LVPRDTAPTPAIRSEICGIACMGRSRSMMDGRQAIEFSPGSHPGSMAEEWPVRGWSNDWTS
jgi:hypothetical protein